MKNHLISFGIGLAAGCFGGLIGLGGGIIMVPLLVGLLKLDQCRAHGTSLVVLIFTGISGAVTYSYHVRSIGNSQPYWLCRPCSWRRPARI